VDDPTSALTAIHEAGHAVIAAVSGVRFDYVTIGVIEDFKGSGNAVVGHMAVTAGEELFLTRMHACIDGDPLPPDDLDHCECHAVVSLAGFVTEHDAMQAVLPSGDFDPGTIEGGQLDVSVACSLVRVLFAQSFWVNDDRLAGPEDLSELQTHKLAKLWEVCLGLSREHRNAIEALARELLNGTPIAESRVLAIVRGDA